MECVYASMLLYKAGKEVNEANIKKVLEAAGAKIDEAQIKSIVASLDGVDIDKVIKEASVVPVAAPVAATQTAADHPKVEGKKKEEEEKKAEEAAAGLSSLFG